MKRTTEPEPISINFLGPRSLASRASRLCHWIARTGEHGPQHGGKVTLSYVYRLALVRGLESLETERDGSK